MIDTFHINGTNPIDYVNSLQKIGNKKHKLWNGFELTFDNSSVKTNSQIFIKNDLHFYRTDYEVGFNILLKFNQEELDKKYVDFRINNLGNRTSIIEDKILELNPAHKREQSFHVFLKRDVIGLDREVIETKLKTVNQCASLNKITNDILSIPASGNSNALKIESKLLELSYAYLEYLHNSQTYSPSFLNCNRKIQCCYNAKDILIDNFIDPPSIKALSKKVGLNSNQLKVGFKHLFSTTIRQFVISHRLEHAQQLILNTQLPVGIISNKVGYINHGHFSKLYREKFGLSPLSERKIKVLNN